MIKRQLTGDSVAGTSNVIPRRHEYCDMPPKVVPCSHSFIAISMAAPGRLPAL